MAKRYSPKRLVSTTKLPIHTLSGGVSRQAQSKRLTSEAQTMDNALVSLERSFEKRPGFSIVPQDGFTGNIKFTETISATYTRTTTVAVIASTAHGLKTGDTITINFSDGTTDGDYIITGYTTDTFTVTTTQSGTVSSTACSYVITNNVQNSQRLDLFPLQHSVNTTKDYWFYWFNINENNRFLLAIDYKAAGSTDILMHVFRVRPDGTWSNETPYSNSPTNSQQDSTIINAETRAYVTFGHATNQAKDVLKATTVGSSIVILNTLVKAGFTGTDSTASKLFDLSGAPTDTDDPKGSKVVYYSSARYMLCSDNSWKVAQQSEVISSLTWTGTLAVGTSVTFGTAPTLPSGVTFGDIGTTNNVNPNTRTKVFISTSSSKWMMLSGWSSSGTVWTVESFSGSWTSGNQTSTTRYSGYYPEVEDFIWGDPSEAWFGQSLVDFSEIRFPPEWAEVHGNNGLNYGNYTEYGAKNMLLALYGNISGGSSTGAGKIYYTAAPYLNFGSGYYRVVSSTSKPYTKKIRSPDSFSVLDSKRMPQKILFDASANIKWTANQIAWSPRTSGNRYSNPGPSIFLSDDKLSPRQVSIKAVSTFRDRLYFAAEDVVFTSQLGQYEDLFLADPSNIVATDPIDIRASSNTFSEIVSLTPFNTYLFINTLGNIQYELKGSQNQITPLTAEISPTAFYATSRFLEPQLLGSLIYFLDSSKLYLYFSSESTNLATAQEMTVTCADYIPTNIRQVCTAPSQNCIVMIDNISKNNLYFYMSRFAGDRNIQNAFFRYVLNTNDSVLSNQSYDDYIYSVISRSTTQNTSPSPIDITAIPAGAATPIVRYTLEKTYMRSLDTSIPRLDRMFKLILTPNNSSYDGVLNQTTIKVPMSFNYTDIPNIQLITDSTWLTDVSGERDYEIANPIAYAVKNSYLELVFSGRYVRAVGNPLVVTYDGIRSVNLGLKFRMEVELSTQFVRDANNNAIDGVLSLRTITTRHKKTGNYDISVSNRGRTPIISSFTNQDIDTNEDVLSLENIEEEGEFMTSVLGFADAVDLKIVSEYPTPCNIVNIEIKGKFIQKYSSLTT